MTLKKYIEDIDNEDRKEELEEGLKIFKLSNRLEKAIMRVEKKKMPEGSDPGIIKKCIDDLKRFKKNAMMIEDKYENGSLSKANAKKQVKRLVVQVRVFSKNAQNKLDVKILKKTGLTIAISTAIIIAVGLAVYFGVSGNINLAALGSDVTKIFNNIKAAGMEASKTAPGIIKDTASKVGGAVGAAAGAVEKEARKIKLPSAEDAKTVAGTVGEKAGEVAGKVSGAAKSVFGGVSGFFTELWTKGTRAVQGLMEEGAMDRFWRKTSEEEVSGGGHDHRSHQH